MLPLVYLGDFEPSRVLGWIGAFTGGAWAAVCGVNFRDGKHQLIATAIIVTTFSILTQMLANFIW
ncbi:hypothetical protein LRP52_40400 [Photobacterium sp. ZSDE20]|nr:hypothetical protein [Photobacterium sp. ZSDE20]